MSDSTHTEGDWVVHYPDVGADYAWAIVRGGALIASVNFTCAKIGHDGDARRNADLLAAAPKLLDACRSARALLSGLVPADDEPEAKVAIAVVRDQINEALAKAEGS